MRSGEDAVPVLLVDDRREDQLAVGALLADRNYALLCAGSGAEGLRHVLNRDFAVILLDVMLPDMDGFEVATIIKGRAKSRHTPILFLTATGLDAGSLHRAYSVGAVDYLTKPIDSYLFRAKVEVFVDLYRKDQRIRRQAEELREADRRERELELGELRLASMRRYHNLADAIPQIVWTAGPDGGAEYFNRRWVEYTGMSTDAAHGWGWLSVLHPDDAAEHEQRWRAALAQADVFEAECRLRRGGDGAYRWHLCRVLRETDEAGRLRAWLGTYTDCEDLKRAHRESEEANRVAQLAIQARDEFLSIASHELRTPLAALQLNLQNLDRAGGLPAEKLQSALRQTQRLGRLIDNLLDLSRITAGQRDLEREPFDLGTVVREIAERMQEEASRAGCALELALAPAPGSWDRLRVEQVVTNLVSNALRYAPGAPIRLEVRGEGDRAVLEVTDHGPGIEAEDRERIFTKFARAGARSHKGGLGMGLYIVRQIVEAHGGQITVESQPEHGSTFTVTLPRAVPAELSFQAMPFGAEEVSDGH